MKTSLSQNNACGRVKPTAPSPTTCVTGEAEEFDSVAQIPGETIYDPAIIAVDAESVLQEAVTSVASGVSAALATLAKHCPTPIAWKVKSKRQHSALETEDSPKITKRRRQLIGLGRPRQEEVLLAWFTHALVPSDVHGECEEVVQNPCDLEVERAPHESISHISIKRRKTAHRVSLTSIPEVDEGWSYWLARPLRTPWTFGASPGVDLSSSNFLSSRRLTTSVPVALVSSSRAYASCFAAPHRPPSVIHWKLS
ncbi:hypothetical protein AZE42_02629 [Rhizopogon vesiculosus]|uniref:Uncharacterized protein n=1 Tax=Rhizopogon vesiculosus TaxID=180088 RepID=A0A1J8PNU0_9AGAM|nr:hypothetical protein AZE42_02629 [Rhizopogon vesiculosus]